MDLEAEGCYQNPSIYGDDEELNEKAAALNRYASMDRYLSDGGRRDRSVGFRHYHRVAERG